MSQQKKNIASGIFFFLFAVALYWGSYSIVVTTADAMGPQFFPRTVAILMGILSVVQIVINIKKQDQGMQEEEGAFNVRGAATIGILILYALLVEKVGFVVMTGLYLFGQIVLLLSESGRKSKKTLAVTCIVSAVTPVLIYQLFYQAFSIFLPTGILG